MIDSATTTADHLALAHAAGSREALAVIAAWHLARERDLLAGGDLASRTSGHVVAARLNDRADVHASAARHAKALAAAADDPAGPLPVRVRYRIDVSDPSYVTLRVFLGPEHGGAPAGTLIVRAWELPAIRAGWPGAAFVEETPGATR